MRDPIERSRQAGLRLGFPRVASASLRSLMRFRFDFGLLDNSVAMNEVGPLLAQWPEHTLLITATTVAGRRVVFGEQLRPPLRSAIAASCAIPLVFPPVRIAGRAYVDGGVRSPTNADVLLDHDVEVAIVVSPMSGGSGRRLPGPDTVVKRIVQRALRAEIAKLEAAGVATVVFEPDAATVRSTGWNLLDRRALRDVTRGAFLSATRDVDDADRAVLTHLRPPKRGGRRRVGAKSAAS